MIDNNANIDFQDKFGKTLSHYAIINHKCNDMIKILLHNNANINIQDNNECTPLHFSVKDVTNTIDSFKLLVQDSNIKINLQNKDGNTPLHLVCQKSSIYDRHYSIFDIVQLLLKSNAKMYRKNYQKQTAKDVVQDMSNTEENEKVINIFIYEEKQKNIKIYKWIHLKYSTNDSKFFCLLKNKSR